MPIVRETAWYFSPDEDADAALLAAAASATASLHALIYAVNLPALADVLVAKRAAGLVVGLVADSTEAGGASEKAILARLAAGGVEVVISRSPSGHILHSKVLCVDQALGALHNASRVALGSLNFTVPGGKEINTLEITNDPSVCDRCFVAYTAARAFGLAHLPQPYSAAPGGGVA